MSEITLRMKAAIDSSIATKRKLLDRCDDVAKMAASMIQIYEKGRKLLIAGNGGSAADAQHFAAEITCQYKLDRNARPALALHCDTSAMTAWGNDRDFRTFFARQVEAHGREGDGLVVISTSGNSEDLLHAAEAAVAKKIEVFSLLGRDGGKLYDLGLSGQSVIVSSDDTPRIQECHILLIHMLCEELDRFFYEQDRVVVEK